MNRKYTVRGILILTLLVAFGVAWFAIGRENREYKSKLSQLTQLQVQLNIMQGSLRASEKEFIHWSRVVGHDDWAIMFDSQRRRAQAQTLIARTEFEIDCLLGLASESSEEEVLKQQRLEIVNSDINDCLRLKTKLIENPYSNAEDVSAVEEQLDYLKQIKMQLAE